MSTLPIAQANLQKYFNRLQRLYDFSKVVLKGQSEEFISRCENIAEDLTNYEEYAEKILSFSIAESPENTEASQKKYCDHCKSYEEMYTGVMDTLTKCKRFMKEKEKTDADSSPRTTSVRLPKISLRQFDGSIKNWSIFYENFKILIHENGNLSDIEKFHYLLSTLSGPALSLTKHLPITGDNYAIAWNSLVARYQNDRTLGNHLLDIIWNQPVLNSATTASMTLLLSSLNDSVESLKNLNLENLDDFILLHIGLKKLPVYLRRKFESHHVKTDIPTFEDLTEFIREQIKITELSYVQKAQESSTQKSRVYLSNGKTTEQRNFKQCPLCPETHALFMCDKFKALSTKERVDKIKGLHRCYNCFSQAHGSKECISKYSCRKCGARHHTLLCYSSENFSATMTTDDNMEEGSDQETRNFAANSKLKDRTTLLGTAQVMVKDIKGHYQKVRVLIDSGAMSSFISKECAHRLKLPILPNSTIISGLADKKVNTIGSTKCQLKPRLSDKPELFVNAIVIPVITDQLPCSEIAPEVKQHWKHLCLADPDFDQIDKVDMLLGAEIFPYIYTGERQFSSDKGSALLSIYGWIITGEVQNVPKQTNFLTVEDQSLKDILTKFWLIEEPSSSSVINPDDEFCEKVFQQGHYQDDTGRYVVPLLLKNDAPTLSNSYELAKKRLSSIEQKLSKDENTRKAYSEFLKEYENLGHMQEVKKQGEAEYYIPHHCVVRLSSLSTKLRVVFDASMATFNGISLNQVVHTGPKLQSDITKIIIKFRTHRIAFTADICKMFRQILIRPQDRKYQHILWRESQNEPIKEYQLNTVTYGITSSPFLANRTVKQVAVDEKENFPIATKILDEDIYVDDLVSGKDDVTQAIQARDELNNATKKHGFDLKKWSCSHPEVLRGLDESEVALPTNHVSFETGESTTLGVLGLRWCPKNDSFSYNEVEFSNKVTKRAILSNISRIFDPVGWITPVVLGAKIIIQKLWISGLNWDDPVPHDIENSWRSILDQLSLLTKLQIPRFIFNPENKRVMLIGFSDGSQTGYGATIYLRIASDSEYQSNLLIAKSKVAPTKPLTVPRLELCGAELLTKIMTTALNSLKSTDYIVEKISAFTDATTVLSWLTTPPYKLKTYVANRVVNILEIIPADHWSHVATHENPADLASRSTLPKDLVNNQLWWNGPSWLKLPTDEWKTSPIHTFSQKSDLPELKSESKTFVSAPLAQNFTKNYSSFTRLQRITAWCLRFYTNVKRSAARRKKTTVENNVSGPLTTQELNFALTTVIKIVQAESFSDEIQALKTNKTVSRRLINLNPFLDPSGILRVGGRLKLSNLPIEAKHPAILPKRSHVTQLIIRHYHEINLHAGPRLLQSILSQKFWIISARSSIRSELHRCVTCFKAAPRNQPPLMSNLPQVRVTPSRCFLKVGTDFGGPFFLKESSRRNATAHKAYICLFVCMTTKAIHLELVSNLSTEAFLAAFDRFVSRRGLCHDIFSDSGTNFVGAKNHLYELYQFLQNKSNQEKLTSKMAEKDIRWHFIPPSSPHFGGLWEAGIKSVKYHLTRVIGDQKLTFEEFTTVLIKIEAVLNSRPLCAMSAEIEDIDALTPAHFLVGGPLLSLPEYDWVMTPENRLSRWQLLQKISQHFWKKWSSDYLNCLQQRHKWQHRTDSLKINDLVLIKDDNLAPLRWKLGRIIDLHPGTDDIARVATVKTTSTVLKRPIVKLYRLPVEVDEKRVPEPVPSPVNPPNEDENQVVGSKCN